MHKVHLWTRSTNRKPKKRYFVLMPAVKLSTGSSCCPNCIYFQTTLFVRIYFSRVWCNEYTEEEEKNPSKSVNNNKIPFFCFFFFLSSFFFFSLFFFALHTYIRTTLSFSSSLSSTQNKHPCLTRQHTRVFTCIRRLQNICSTPNKQQHYVPIGQLRLFFLFTLSVRSIHSEINLIESRKTETGVCVCHAEYWLLFINQGT